MAFTSKDVMELRQRTGVGMMDCKKALVETDGDMEKAIDYLREKGHCLRSEETGQDRVPRHRGQLHPHERQDRRVARSQLRDRLRGDEPRFQGARAQHRDAHCSRSSQLRHQGGSPLRRAREGERDPHRAGEERAQSQARCHHPQDGRRQDPEVLQGRLPDGAGLRPRPPPRPSASWSPRPSPPSARRSR